ncbi:MAG: HAMP domain-containing protein [Caldilineaceae bacterium]|nr:HAMP domain-containing protein [Caldilineaceae bacterium]
MQRKGKAFELWQQQVERFANLRWRLTALLAMILICTLLVIGVTVVTFVQQTEVAAWRGRQSEATRNTVRVVTNLLENTQKSLTFINLVGLDNIEADQAFLNQLLRQYPILQEIVYLNSQGQPVAATTAAIFLEQERAQVVETPWFRAAQAGNVYYGDLTIADTAAPYLIMAVPAPNASVIAARVNMAVLWTLVADLRFGKSGLTYLIDRRNQIIAHTEPQVALAQTIWPKPTAWATALTPRTIWYGEYVNFRDQRVVGAVAWIPGVDWVVVTELANAEAFAASRRAYWLLGSGMLAFMILMMWLSAEWLEGLILTPIERLRDGAERIGQGDLTHRIELVRKDEIGQVAVAFNQMAGELAGLYESLEQKIAERTQQLEEQAAELARSNRELAQFAYVASHDLQEPLRMVTSYVQLIERRYRGQLDGEADSFIAFAVDGATRMQQLIRDLLAYSRVGTRTQPFRLVDCQLIWQQVLDNLQMAIQESQAVVTADPLPPLMVNPTQLSQLFQNLLTNAIKFRRTHPPTVHLSARYLAEDAEWLFVVADNGIGIAPEDFDRIFLIFQRLHTRSEYPGTGIGLAICKKIVDLHGGRLWVESTVGQGTTFYFTLPTRAV